MKKQLLKEIIEKKEKKIEFAIITNLENGASCIFEKDKLIDKNFEKYKEKIINQYLKRNDYKQTRNTLIEYLRDDSKHVDIADFNSFNNEYDSIMDLEKYDIL